MSLPRLRGEDLQWCLELEILLSSFLPCYVRILTRQHHETWWAFRPLREHRMPCMPPLTRYRSGAMESILRPFAHDCTEEMHNTIYFENIPGPGLI